MAAPPERSKGARMERRAFLRYLRRQLRQAGTEEARSAISQAVAWVLDRRRRYESRPGGLGRR